MSAYANSNEKLASDGSKSGEPTLAQMQALHKMLDRVNVIESQTHHLDVRTNSSINLKSEDMLRSEQSTQINPAKELRDIIAKFKSPKSYDSSRSYLEPRFAKSEVNARETRTVIADKIGTLPLTMPSAKKLAQDVLPKHFEDVAARLAGMQNTILTRNYLTLAVETQLQLENLCAGIQDGTPTDVLTAKAEQLRLQLSDAIIRFPDCKESIMESVTLLAELVKLFHADIKSGIQSQIVSEQPSSGHAKELLQKKENKSQLQRNADLKPLIFKHAILKPSASGYYDPESYEPALPASKPSKPKGLSASEQEFAASVQRNHKSSGINETDSLNEPLEREREGYRINLRSLSKLKAFRPTMRQSAYIIGALILAFPTYQLITQVKSGFSAATSRGFAALTMSGSKPVKIAKNTASQTTSSDDMETGTVDKLKLSNAGNSGAKNKQLNNLDIPAIPQALSNSTLVSEIAAGEPGAMYDLGMKLREGRGVERDLTGALSWFKAGAQVGHIPSTLLYAKMLEKGEGGSRDIGAAMSAYQKAADKGSREANHLLAGLYASGASGAADFKQAFSLFERAARAGNVDSQYNLGVLYATGQGTKQSQIEAYKWFALAAQSGDKNAATSREDVARQLDPTTLANAKALVRKFSLNASANMGLEVQTPNARPATQTSVQ